MKLVLVLLIAFAVAACGLGQPTIIDGLSVGGAAGCGSCNEPPSSPNCGACESIAVLANRGIEQNWPGHPPIASLSFHREGPSVGPNGEFLSVRSGSQTVALVVFADGTRHALAVYCGVGGCRLPQ